MEHKDSQYPKWKYHPEHGSELLKTLEDEKSLEGHWYDSPAEFGMETCPGKRPDKEIAKRKKVSKEGAK